MPGSEWATGAVLAGVYEVRECLGVGGMGVVHRVRHLGWGEDLAVKSPGDALWAGPGGIDAFLDEARVWIELPPHPHICTCHYVRTLAGEPRLFAELVDGGSLAVALAAGRYDQLDTILDVAVQVAWGLQAAHAAGVVHQDVKPANVLLTRDGTAKLTDFGIARAQQRAAGRTGVPAGADPTASILVTTGGLTPAYASPEQAFGERHVGRRSDVWSWAATVLEMLAGRKVWSVGWAAGEGLEAYLATGPYPGRPRIPDGLAELLRACLTIDPQRRPADLGVVAQRLTGTYAAAVGQAYPRPVPETVVHRADGLNNKALSLLDLGAPEQADRCWADGLAVDPRHVETAYNRGLTRWRAGQATDLDVVAGLEAARAAHDGDAELLLGLVHLERGDSAAALAVLNDAARSSPDDGDVAAALVAARERPEDAAPVLQVDPSGVDGVAVSADGRFLLCAGRSSCVYLWDLENGRHVHTLRGHRRPVAAVAVTPDGRYGVSAGGWDHDVRRWDLATGRCLADATVPDKFVGTIAVTPDGRRALVRAGGRLWRWDCRRRRPPVECGPPGTVTAFAATADGRRVLASCAEGRLWWWDIGAGRALWTVRDAADVSALGVDRAGRRGVSCDTGGHLRVWDLAAGAPIGSFLTRCGHLDELAVSGDGRFAVTGGRDLAVRWWDLDAGRCLRTFTGHTAEITAVAIVSDGSWAVSSSYDGTVRRWPLRTGGPAVLRLSRPRSAADTVAGERQFRRRLQEARRLLDGGDDLTAYWALRQARTVAGFERDPQLRDLWRRATVRGRRTTLMDVTRTAELAGHAGWRAVAGVALSDDGTAAVSGGTGGIRRWDLSVPRGEVVVELPHLMVFAATSDGRWVLGSEGDLARVWELPVGRCVHTLEAPGRPGVDEVAITSNGRYGLTSDLVLIHFWDLRSGRRLGQLERGMPSALAVTANAQRVLSGGLDGDVRVWDPATGECLRRLAGPDASVTAVAMTPDGRRGLSGDAAGGVTWWDLVTGRCLHMLRGHSGEIGSAAVTPDGRHALTGGHDHTLRWWDLDAGRCVHVERTTSVHAVATTPDARHAVSGGTDGQLTRWEIDWDYDGP